MSKMAGNPDRGDSSRRFFRLTTDLPSSLLPNLLQSRDTGRKPLAAE
jgi:hypothetical protein